MQKNLNALVNHFLKYEKKHESISTSLLNMDVVRWCKKWIESHGSKFPLVKVTDDIGTSLAKTSDKRRHVYSPTMLISTKSPWYLGSPRFPPANYKLPEDLQDCADLRNLLTSTSSSSFSSSFFSFSSSCISMTDVPRQKLADIQTKRTKRNFACIGSFLSHAKLRWVFLLYLFYNTYFVLKNYNFIKIIHFRKNKEDGFNKINHKIIIILNVGDISLLFSNCETTLYLRNGNTKRKRQL